jgi:putative transposase
VGDKTLKGEPPLKRSYHTIEKQGKVGERKLAEFLVRNGQALLPMLELIEQSRMAIDELIDVMGRASIEAVLELSAQQVAGPQQQGKAREGDMVWHGTQAGRVFLKERQLKVNKPRLRRKGRGANKEIPVPAYEAMQQEPATGERMLEILLNGVSTRRYQQVIPEMADTVGVSKSTVSRETIEASEAALEELMERRFDDVDLLIIYIDGMKFQQQCVLAAVGVDVEGRKHVLALREGATENAEAAKDLLQHLVEHGVDPARRRLFVIDGSKALRAAINAVFGAQTPVQRCRNHKLRNAGATSARSTSTDGLADAGSLENEPEGGHGQVPPDRKLVGARLSRACSRAAGRLGRVLHH